MSRDSENREGPGEEPTPNPPTPQLSVKKAARPTFSITQTGMLEECWWERSESRFRPHLLVPQAAPFTKHVCVITRVTHEFAFEEGHVEAGGVVVDKLEQEHLHRQLVLVLQVGFGDLCKCDS